MTIEERVEQLEAQVAQLTGEGTYTLGKAGETIDAILDGIETAAIYHGSETITVASGDTTGSTALALGFKATAATQVVASVRHSGAPTPFNNPVLTLHFTTGMIYAYITAGYNTAQDIKPLAAGTYYIDWIVLDKGES